MIAKNWDIFFFSKITDNPIVSNGYLDQKKKIPTHYDIDFTSNYMLLTLLIKNEQTGCYEID